MLLFYITFFYKKEIRRRDVFLNTRSAFLAGKIVRYVLRVQDWITVGKNFTRSFCRAEHYTAFSIRISSLACGQAFDYFVKFSFNFLVFSCSTQILSKIAEGMLTATSRF